MAPSRDNLLNRSSIDPVTFKAMADTFDEAWAAIKGDFADAPKQEVEAVRTALARTIIDVTTKGHADAAAIKRAALGAAGTFARPSDEHKMN